MNFLLILTIEVKLEYFSFSYFEKYRDQGVCFCFLGIMAELRSQGRDHMVSKTGNLLFSPWPIMFTHLGVAHIFQKLVVLYLLLLFSH